MRCVRMPGNRMNKNERNLLSTFEGFERELRGWQSDARRISEDPRRTVDWADWFGNGKENQKFLFSLKIKIVFSFSPDRKGARKCLQKSFWSQNSLLFSTSPLEAAIRKVFLLRIFCWNIRWIRWVNSLARIALIDRHNRNKSPKCNFLLGFYQLHSRTT